MDCREKVFKMLGVKPYEEFGLKEAGYGSNKYRINDSLILEYKFANGWGVRVR